MKILHVGCATHPLPEFIPSPVEETRLDINPNCKPDIVASMTDMGSIGTYDLIYCSHALEHLYPHDVPKALSEFMRVLLPGGHAVILVPDLQDVRATDDVLYQTLDGPVTGIDLIYGLPATIKASLHMAHHTGFTETTMKVALGAAGFSKTIIQRLPWFNLLAVGIK